MQPKYRLIKHLNSNRAKKQGLWGWFTNKFGKPEFYNHVSYQFVRDNQGSTDPLASEREKRKNTKKVTFTGSGRQFDPAPQKETLCGKVKNFFSKIISPIKKKHSF